MFSAELAGRCSASSLKLDRSQRIMASQFADKTMMARNHNPRNNSLRQLLAVMFFAVLYAVALLANSSGNPVFKSLATSPRFVAVSRQASENNGTPSAAPSKNLMGDHYLMLVTRTIASMTRTEEIAQFNQSPYDGLAVMFTHAYDTSRPLSAAEIDAQIATWRKVTTKDLWPWLYLNRMIGVDDSQNDYHTKNDVYFHRIKGIDLDDKAGARNDFLQIWGNSLRAARDSKVPGIVCDLEFYNYYREYDATEIARLTGKKPEEAVELLEQLGTRMADIAAAQYPDAMIWFFFTGLGDPGYKVIEKQPYYLSSAYIAMGLLDEIKKQHFHLRVLDGGEVGLGYCHPSVQQFQDQIWRRADSFRPQLQKYAGILEVGGTMTLWSDLGAKEGWLKEGDCGTSSARNLEELQPYLELILKSYRYNWIYGSTSGGYYAFQPLVAPRFDAMIARAKAHATATLAQ